MKSLFKETTTIWDLPITKWLPRTTYTTFLLLMDLGEAAFNRSQKLQLSNTIRDNSMTYKRKQ